MSRYGDGAMRLEVIGRNVASIVSPPKVGRGEIEILTGTMVGWRAS
jgi:hypothetical protein